MLFHLKGLKEGFSAVISPMLFFSNDLSDRIFSMQRFYKENEASLTPSSVAFAQVVWDISVNKALHALGSNFISAIFLNIRFRGYSKFTYAFSLYAHIK